MKLSGMRINFLGDSITEGVGASSSDAIFMNQMKAMFGLAEANNYGISGTRFAIQKNPTVDNPSFDQYFASRIPDMKADVDAIVIFGGTNDYGHGDAPIGNSDDRTPETFYGACHDLFKRMIEKYPEQTIVIMTPLHRTDEDILRYKGPAKEPVTLKTYVDIIREVAEFYSLPVCDLYKISGIQPQLSFMKEKCCPDGLHPNDKGHQIMATRLGNFLQTL